MASLQDQLLKAGMVNEKKAKQIKKEKRKQTKKLPKGQQPENEARAAAREGQLAKAAKDKELNRQQQAVAQEKAIAAQIKQLVATHRINRKDKDNQGDIAYQFVHDRKIKKIYINTKLQTQLERGHVAIIVQGEHYEIIPSVIAEKICKHDESLILTQNNASVDELEEDDPYADFKIPDDLMW